MSEEVLDNIRLLKDAELKFDIAMNHFNTAPKELFEEVNDEVTIALRQLNNVRKVLDMPIVEL